MTLKEQKISETESQEKILVQNNHQDYIFFKNKHSWHSLEICKLMKKNLNLFLKKDSRELFIEIQKIAKRQNEIKSYLQKLEKEDKKVFNKMFRSKYYQEQVDNISKTKKIIKNKLKKEIKDLTYKERGIEYITEEYTSFFLDNRWFECICFYLLCDLKIKSKVYLDVMIKLGTGEQKQIDNLFITQNYCAIIECKSGDNFNDHEIAKIKVYKDSFGADLGIILRSKEKVEYSFKEEIVGVYIIDGLFLKKPSEIKKKLKSLLSR